jgi:amidohydrolase
MLHRIQRAAEALEPSLIAIRRHLHENPDRSGEEQPTAAYVAEALVARGIASERVAGGTGVLATLPARGSDDRVLAIRVDLDALPIHEATGLPFASRRHGVMHACGHDVHATLGLGAAMALAELADRDGAPRGEVRFLFQPAEETGAGALRMIEAGAMRGVSAILGVHVFPTIAAGSIGVRYGALTAAADGLEIVIHGEGGHGARPHEAVDAIWIAAQVVTTLQQAIGRTQNALRPVVLTIGQVSGGTAPNVIADRARLLGTVRSLHPETRARLPEWIEGIVGSLAAAYGARAEVTYTRGSPSIQNDAALTALVESAAREALGGGRVLVIDEPSLGAEDFAFYLDHAPGSMFRLGVGRAGEVNAPLHHPQFSPDESAIAVGVVTLAYAAYRFFGAAAPG